MRVSDSNSSEMLLKAVPVSIPCNIHNCGQNLNQHPLIPTISGKFLLGSSFLQFRKFIIAM